MHGGRGIVGEEAILSARHDTQETLVGIKIENRDTRLEQNREKTSVLRNGGSDKNNVCVEGLYNKGAKAQRALSKVVSIWQSIVLQRGMLAEAFQLIRLPPICTLVLQLFKNSRNFMFISCIILLYFQFNTINK